MGLCTTSTPSMSAVEQLPARAFMARATLVTNEDLHHPARSTTMPRQSGAREPDPERNPTGRALARQGEEAPSAAPKSPPPQFVDPMFAVCNRMPQNLSEFLSISQNLSEFLRIFQNSSEFLRISAEFQQNLRRISAESLQNPHRISTESPQNL